jgi:outer membrane lipoprotein-sorting protein
VKVSNGGRVLLVVVAALAMGQTLLAHRDALGELAAHWAGLKDVHSLTASFVCEKELAALDTPLHSEGRLWIGKQNGKTGEEGVRFSTEKPYVSELILAGGKVYGRSQHETEWTKTNQAARPGLTAVMGQLGGWSTGDTSQIAAMYSVAKGAVVIPAMPAAMVQPDGGVDVFVLTPTNADLAKAVKRVTLALDEKTNVLRYIEIVTQQDDATRYWFFDVKLNADLPVNVFKAGAELMVPGEDK